MSAVRQREPRLLIPALLKAARGMPCTLRIPDICNGNPETTVWAHSNYQRHGKGVGLKAHDCFGCFACSACHCWLDAGRAETRFQEFLRAHDETLYLLFKEGKLKVIP
jgi:hypothetical protein